MRLKMKQRWAGAFGSHDEGSIVEVPDDVGESLIKGNYAVILSDDEDAFVSQRTFTVAEVSKLFSIPADKLRERVEKILTPEPEPAKAPAEPIEPEAKPRPVPKPDPRAALLSAPKPVTIPES